MGMRLSRAQGVPGVEGHRERALRPIGFTASFRDNRVLRATYSVAQLQSPAVETSGGSSPLPPERWLLSLLSSGLLGPLNHPAKGCCHFRRALSQQARQYMAASVTASWSRGGSESYQLSGQENKRRRAQAERGKRAVSGRGTAEDEENGDRW